MRRFELKRRRHAIVGLTSLRGTGPAVRWLGMWPELLAKDIARLFSSPDLCRRIPADALVQGVYCGVEHILGDQRRHRSRLPEAHGGQHTCWCEREFS